MNVEALRIDSAIKQKKGLHFILTSVIIWTGILIIHLMDLPILTKNLFSFFATGPMMPLAFLISKIIKADFQNKDNPLTKLGIIFSVNQILYLLIAMWVYHAVPDKMLMVMAIIFGAHLMPFSWLYRSKSYMVFSIIIPLVALLVGLKAEPYILALTMVFIEISLSIFLIFENRSLSFLHSKIYPK